MLVLQQLSYSHTDRTQLFDKISCTIANGQKVALVGNNGSGKSTLLRIIAGELAPSSGTIHAQSKPFYVPQHFGQFNKLSIAQALKVDVKLRALNNILAGELTDQNLAVLDDDWQIEERCREALAHWGLTNVDLTIPMTRLSGGEKTRVFLSGIAIHDPEFVLLDEPGNHLDVGGRALLQELIRSARQAMILVSHDRTLLNTMPHIMELSKRGLTVYGGNYDFYSSQKEMEFHSLAQELDMREKELRKAKATEREAMERKQKLDARARKKQTNAGVPTIFLNTLRNNAEKSSSRLKEAHAQKTGGLAAEIGRLRNEMPGRDKMRIEFDDAQLHTGKMLLRLDDVQLVCDGQYLWPEPIRAQINSGQRLAIEGRNGSGKTTLIRLLLGEIAADSGTVERAEIRSLYIDQDYSLIDPSLTLLEQVQCFNSIGLDEPQIKSRLTHFLFLKDDWGKRCTALSGGEKMRLVLCCLTVSGNTPDLIILDEPTNNLDIQNTEILTSAINDYRGTLLVVSHDRRFLEEIGIEGFIHLTRA